MNAKRFDFLSILTYSILVFVLGIVALHFIFGFQYVVILTDSMKPNINPDDMVITRPVSPEDVHVGDVILYRIEIGNATYRITHRVVDIKTDPDGNIYYVTKGDNREYADPWRVYPSQVVGRVVLVIPRAGIIWYYTPIIIFGLLLIVVATLAYDIAWSLLEEEPIRPKSRKADLIALRRKKIKVYHYRRR